MKTYILLYFIYTKYIIYIIEKGRTYSAKILATRGMYTYIL